MESSLAMLAFVRAVECKGFTAAAVDLGVTPSAVSKLVTRLEKRLGVRLLQRSTRHLALTAEGEIYFERVQRIVAEIEDAESDVMRFCLLYTSSLGRLASPSIRSAMQGLRVVHRIVRLRGNRWPQRPKWLSSGSRAAV